MARKKNLVEQAAAAAAAAVAAQQEDEEILPPNPLGDMDELAEEDYFRALHALDTGGDVEWTVEKLTGPYEEKGFIERIPSSQLDLQRFHDVYGAGEYRVIGRRGGVYVKGSHKKIKISNVTYKSPNVSAAAAQPTGASAVADVLAIIKAEKDKSSANLKEWGAILIPAFAPVIAGLFNRNQLTDLVGALGAMKGLNEPPKSETWDQQLDRMLGAIAKLKEATGTGEGASTGATWVDLIRDGVQAIKPVAEAAAQRLLPPGAPPLTAPVMLPPASLRPYLGNDVPNPSPPGASATAPATPTAAPTGASPASSSGASSTNNEVKSVGLLELLPWLRATLAQLVIQAARARDPELYAEVTCDNLPEGTNLTQLKGFIERTDWWAQLQTFEPKIAPYQGWFQQYREAVLEWLQEEIQNRAPPAPITNLGTGAGGEIHEGSTVPNVIAEPGGEDFH